jgi:hypothetical protein
MIYLTKQLAFSRSAGLFCYQPRIMLPFEPLASGGVYAHEGLYPFALVSRGFSFQP